MKKLLLLFIALVTSLGTTWAANKTVYLNPGKWDQSTVTEAYAIWAWGDGNSEWINMTQVEGSSIFKVTIPEGKTEFLFTIRNSEDGAPSWDPKNIWAQTNNISTFADNSMFTITFWHNGTDNDGDHDGNWENSSYIYTATPVNHTVQFATTKSWTNVYSYTYDPVYLGAWPGIQMTDTGEKVYDLNTSKAYSIYSLSFLAETGTGTIMFNDGEGGEGKEVNMGDLINGKLYLDGIQENLAYGATVTWGTDANHTDDINGAGLLSNITDGNDNTNMQAKFNGDATVLSLVLDLGETKTFNSLLINQTGDRWNTAFQIFVSNDNAAWTEVTTKSTGVTTGRFIATFAEQNARYVKYVSSKNDKNVTDEWGAGLAEIQLYNFDELPTLSSIELTAATTAANIDDEVALTVAGISTIDNVHIGLGAITWNNDNTTAGTITDGVYTAKAAGTSVISATADGKTSNTVTITVTGALPVPATYPAAPTEDESDVLAVFSDTYSKGITENNPSWGITGIPTTPLYTKEQTVEIDGHNVVYVKGYGFNSRSKNAVRFTKDAYDKVVVYLYPKTATSGRVFKDNGYATGVTFSGLTPGQWNKVEVDIDFGANADPTSGDNPNYFLVALDGESEFYLDHYYFYKTSAPDDVKPVMVSAALASKTHNSATLTLNATDNSGKVKFHVVDTTNGIDVTSDNANSGEDFDYTVTGLTAETAYNFTITAVDANGNVSDNNKAVAVTTDEAPAGQLLVNGTHSVLVKGRHYTALTENNYVLTITSEEDMDGLGGSFWSTYQSGTPNNVDMRTQAVVSGDKKTITVTATSDNEGTKPQLYTPLYVMMPGEVNFGNLTIEWEDIASPSTTEGYYIVGNMNEWTINNSYKLTLNESAAPTVEYQFPSLALTTESQFKVVYSADGTEKTTWYPDGTGNNYGENGEITADGNYVIFFRPDGDGGDDWFNHVIYVTSMIDTGVDPTTGAHKLVGNWNADIFTSIDAMSKANSYDLTEVTGIGGTIDMIDKTANPYCMFITSAAGKVNRNEVVWNAGENRYDGYAINFTESATAAAPIDINTDINPISVNNPFFQRLFTTAGRYVTLVTPFDYTLPGTDKAWTMTATSAGAGVVNITFTELEAGSTLTKNTPYLYYAGTGGITFNDPGEVVIDWDAQTAAHTEASFVANYKYKTAALSENIYVLPSGVSQESDVVFKKADNANIRPFRAYLTVPSGDAKINVLIDDATGIHSASADMLNALFNIYSIDGKVVRHNADTAVDLPKGVYIINGKKVVVK
ncbi:MAG: discoidin domain-containing protein [Prevotella sp.]|nr:discoidin domain-containing protein [Prevotella sp.]